MFADKHTTHTNIHTTHANTTHAREKELKLRNALTGLGLSTSPHDAAKRKYTKRKEKWGPQIEMPFWIAYAFRTMASQRGNDNLRGRTKHNGKNRVRNSSQRRAKNSLSVTALPAPP